MPSFLISSLPVLLGLFGIFVGSFLNVVILRLRSGEGGIFTGRSHCVSCNHPLSSFDLVPLFSWLFLRGKCRYCGKPVSIQYPIVELGNGLLWLLAAVLGKGDFVQTGFFALLFSFLWTLTVYDARWYELPDELSLPAIFICLIALLFPWAPTWQDALIGAAIPLSFFGLQIAVSRGAWMGGGDLRLGVIMGLLLGWQATLVALFFSYVTGSIIGVLLIALQKKSGKSMLPFGPFLVLGTMIALLWGKEILAWYLGKM